MVTNFIPTYIMILAYLCAPNLSVRVSSQVHPPSSVEELMEEQHREEVLPSSVKTFGTHHGVEWKLSLWPVHYRWQRMTKTPMPLTKESDHVSRSPPFMGCLPWVPLKRGTQQTWWVPCVESSMIIAQQREMNSFKQRNAQETFESRTPLLKSTI